MDGLRYEKYGNSAENYPLRLSIDIERTPYNSSKEDNWHDNLEIQLCTAGMGTVLLDGKRYKFSKGDTIIVNSNAFHRTFTEDFLKYTCLIINADWCHQMDINYDMLDFTPFIQSDELSDTICNLTNIYLNTDDTLRTAKINEILLQLMIKLTENYSTKKSSLLSDKKCFDIVKAVIIFIQKNYNKKISLEEISAFAHYNKYSLCKEFKKYTGQTVFEYLHDYRTSKAISYLTEGYSVTDAAYLCGFENLSFFTKIFKRCTGKKPSDYKNSRA